EKISEEFFQLNRVLLAIAQCDGYLSSDEIKVILGTLAKKGETTEEQETILEDDINNPKDVVELLKGIESDTAKATLILQMSIIPLSDKYVNKNEKDTVLRILDNLDFDEHVKSKAREFISVAAELSDLLSKYI
ncbi:MAG TPA: hypothetical protein PL110_20810, partial [Candidatus Eremiobacteraeota bacterium]|nr:hypothetical protein [Candidatus Eremiobacteraeota bacterium]